MDEMFVFTFKVNYYDEFEGNTKEDTGFVCGPTLKYVTNYLIDLYDDEEINEIKVRATDLQRMVITDSIIAAPPENFSIEGD